jgi:hypothetical protein
VHGYPSGKRVKSVESLFRRAGSSDVFYIPDATVDLASILREPVPLVPAEPKFTGMASCPSALASPPA